MAVLLKSTIPRSALLVGALVLMSGCNGNGATRLPPPDPDPIVPPAISDEFPWRINTLAIPEWYTTLPTQPVADIDGEIASWSWEFGEGAIPATSTEAQPTITLQAAGDYTAVLTITDSLGHIGRIPFTYRVLPPTLPTIEQVTPDGEAGGEFTMSTFGVTTSGPPITTWSWDFGDGALPALSTDAAPQVELQRIGGHTGTIEVCGPFGCSTKDFGYGIRPARPVWHDEVLNAIPTQFQMCLAPDGSARLIFIKDGDLQMAILKDAGSSDPRVESILPPHPLNDDFPVKSMGLVGAPAAIFLVLEPADGVPPLAPPTLIRMRYTGSGVVSSELTGYEPMFRNAYDGRVIAGYPISADSDQIYVGVARSLEDDETEPGILSLTQDGDFIFGGDFSLLAPPSGEENPALRLTNFVLQDIDGVLYQAQTRRGGAPIVSAATLAVGRQVGDLSLGPAAWKMVDIDDRARECPFVNWIPTSSGLQVVYGRFGGTSSFGDYDLALRMAWTDNRDFESAADWQSGFWEAGIQQIHMEVQPLHGSSVAIQSFGPGLAFTRGYGAEPGNIAWHQERLTLGAGVYGPQLVVSAGDDGGQWIAAIDYQTIGGSIDHGTYPTDPQFLLGHLTWE